MKALAEHGILTFELVVVNLYPFEATVARKGVTQEEAIEQIDIGGPTLVRAAAKNHAFTTIATHAAQYSEILDQIKANGCTTIELRRRLAGEAFAQTARYDRAIADFFAAAAPAAEGAFPGTVTIGLTHKMGLRYGENPHQQAALYSRCRQPRGERGGRAATARQGTLLQQFPRSRQCAGDRAAVFRAGGGGDQAQQSLRRRRGRYACRGPATGDGGRPAERLRLGSRAESHG